MNTDRPNTELSDAVDQALAMADKQAAARFLEEKGISFAVIVRVLGEPARRRGRTSAPALNDAQPQATDIAPAAAR